MSQSIDFANVADANFNGTSISEILLNGNNVWTAVTSNPFTSTYLGYFTDPSPAQYSGWGREFAVSENLVITRKNPNIVYVYNATGGFLFTITVPVGTVVDFTVSNDYIVATGYEWSPTHQSKAFIYNTSGVLLHTILEPMTHNSSYYGFHNAVDINGDTIALIGGSSNTYTGKFYIYNTSGTLLNTINRPLTTALEDVHVAMTDSHIVFTSCEEYWPRGNMFIYTISGTLIATVPVTGVGTATFRNVDIDGDVIVVGSGSHWGGGGTAWLYNLSGGLVRTLTSSYTPDAYANSFNGFGGGVSIWGDYIAIGESYFDETYQRSREGRLHVFDRAGNLIYQNTPDSANVDDRMGRFVKIYNGKIYVGVDDDASAPYVTPFIHMWN